MNILIVNDDSIYAPGIALLAKAAKELGNVWVVAPAHQCSAMSHKITLIIHSSPYAYSLVIITKECPIVQSSTLRFF